MSWRIRSVAKEAWRNVHCSPLRSGLIVALTAATIGALAFAELTTTSNLIVHQAEIDAAGGHVYVATSETGLPAGRCSTLYLQTGVESSGEMAALPPVAPTKSPGSSLSAFAATPAILAMLTEANDVESIIAARFGYFVGSEAAQELGLSPGMAVDIGEGPHPVLGVVDTALRNTRTGRSILTPASVAVDSTTCMVAYERGAVTGRREFLAAAFSDVDDVSIDPLIRLGGFSRDPLQDMRRRPTQSAWVLVGAVLAMISWGELWFRRSDIGLYRALGTPRSALVVIGSTESLLTTVPGWLIGFAWAVAIQSASVGRLPSGDALRVAFRSGISAILLFLALMSLPLLITARESIADQLKDL